MILRSAIAAIATILLAGAAFAAPALRADIVVSAAVVTVGDMFEDAGLDAEEALFRSPKPGTTGLVSVVDIETAMARAGLTDFDRNGLEVVRVSRAAAVVDEAALAALIATDLAGRGIIGADMSVETVFATPLTPINAEAVDQPARIISLRYLPGTGGFSARFSIAGVEQPLDVTGMIELMIKAPHIVASLPAGTLLTTSNVEMRSVPLKFVESTGVARLEDVVGKALVRQSREGMLLRPADVAVPLLVSKNDLVTIYFRKGPMTLSVKGQAVTGAALGGPLQVLNLISRRIITAKAIAAGAVEISADPLAVAGL